MVSLAFRNLLHNKMFAVLSVSSVVATMVLLYAQLGFYTTARNVATNVYDQFDYDLVLLSPTHEFSRFTGQIPIRYLDRAKQITGIQSATPLYIGNTVVRYLSKRFETVLLGVDPSTKPFGSPAINRKVTDLQKLDTALFDEVTTGNHVPKVPPGCDLEVNRCRVHVFSTYRHGVGFVGESQMVVGTATMARIVPRFSVKGVSIGLIKVNALVELDVIKERLREHFGRDALVLDRDELTHKERVFALQTKPNGIRFIAGVVLALIVSIAISFQLLAISASRRAKQYATLRALGYYPRDIYFALVTELLLYQLTAFAPATIIALMLYYQIRTHTNLPIAMTILRVLIVVVFSLAVNVIASYFVTRGSLRTDPAELF